MRLITVSALGFSLLLSGATQLAAQTTSEFNSADGQPHTRIQGIEIPSISGQPFTAKIDVLWNQPLANGGMEARSYFTVVARDTQGRVRRETRGFVAANSASTPPLRSFALNDPVAGTRTTCNVASSTCTVTVFHARQILAEPVGPLPGGFSTRERVSLGTQTMGGTQVNGTRETVTTPAGTHGNENALVSSNEEWFSPELKMDMSVLRSDPHFGSETLTVSNLVRGEPSPEWFQIPIGFRTVDQRNNQAGQ